MNLGTTLKNRSIVIAGGSGFLGTSLAEYFGQQGANVTLLTRRLNDCLKHPQQVVWDGVHLDDWSRVMDGCDGLINLCGRSVDCIKSPAHCDEILRSRVDSTHALGAAMKTLNRPPPVWVQMSTAHIYGDPPRDVCTEETEPGIGLAPTVGAAWESAFFESALPEQRKVVMRTSFVVGRDRGAGGGALARLKLIARWGLGGRVGTGRQGISWIHESDLHQIFSLAVLDSKITGIYNVTSPNPVSQSEFMKTLRQSLRIPIGLPATEWMVRLGAHFLLRTDPELALYGRYVLPSRLTADVFEFQYPDLRKAFEDIFE